MTKNGQESIMFESVPEELQKLKRWHLWKDVDGTKVPFRLGGQPAKSNDPETWCGFDFAVGVVGPGNYSGIAFELGDGFCGVDLDNCLDVFGELRSWAWKIVEKFDGVAYMEISPSGRGIKFITRGRKPVGSRCVHKIGDDKQQIECYDKARFWTVTGQVYNRQTEIGDGQAAIDWLCGEYLTSAKTSPPPVSNPPYRNTDGSDLGKRVDSYLSACCTPTEGDRNNAVFKAAGHVKSIVDDSGQSLSDDEILCRVKQWAVPSGLPEAEIETAIRSGLNNGTPREKKYPESGQNGAGFNSADKSEKSDKPTFAGTEKQPITLEQLRILASTEDESEIESKTHIPLPDSVFDNAPGFIGDYLRYLTQVSVKPMPEAFLSAGIALLATVVGRDYGFRFGQWNTRSNVYILTTAGSGAGKDFARGMNARMLRQVDCGLNQGMLGPVKFASDSAMLTTLYEYPKQLWQIDEFSKFLGGINNQRAGQHVTNMAELLLELFSESGNPEYRAKAYADSKKSITLCYPHAVIYGTSTATDFWSNLTTGQVRDGLLGRLLIFEDKYSAPEITPDVELEVDESGCVVVSQSLAGELPAELTYTLKDWQERANGNTPTEIRIRPDAYRRLVTHNQEIDRRRVNEDSMRAALWSRAGEKTSKLSMLGAMARGSEIIELDDTDWAVELVNALTRRMVERVVGSVAENLQEQNVMRVHDILKEGGAMSRRILTRRTRWLNSRDRASILTDLQSSGQIIEAVILRKTNFGQWYGCSFRDILKAVESEKTQH